MSAINFSECIIYESARQYHAQRGANLSSHLLGDARKSLQLYYRKREGLIPDCDRPAYLVGRALHTLALEGREMFEHDYAVGGPINEKTGKPYGVATKAFAEWAARQDKDILTEDQAELVEKMASSIAGHKIANDLLAEGEAEGVVRTEYQGLCCQIRMDWFNPAIATLLDLKTTDDLDWFEADSRRYGYGHQMAFYRAVLARAAGCSVTDIRCQLIAVEKKEPFRTGVWHLSNDVLAVCQAENERVMDRIRECERTGVWPSGYEELRTFDYV